MDPENLTFAGFAMLAVGFLLVIVGALFFGQVYFCIVNPTSCELSPTQAASRIGYSIPLLVLGTILVTPGAIVLAAGYITQHLATKADEEESDPETVKKLLRVCVKCGFQVDSATSYCPSCGNQLTKFEKVS